MRKRRVKDFQKLENSKSHKNKKKKVDGKGVQVNGKTEFILGNKSIIYRIYKV